MGSGKIAALCWRWRWRVIIRRTRDNYLSIRNANLPRQQALCDTTLGDFHFKISALPEIPAYRETAGGCGNKNPLLGVSVQQHGENRDQVGVCADDDCPIEHVVDSICQNSQGNMDIGFLFLMARPGRVAPQALPLLRLKMRHERLHPVALESLHVFAMAGILCWTPSRICGEIINGDQRFVGVHQRISQCSKVYPLEMWFSEIVDRVIQIEPVDIASCSIHHAPQKKKLGPLPDPAYPTGRTRWDENQTNLCANSTCVSMRSLLAQSA